MQFYDLVKTYSIKVEALIKSKTVWLGVMAHLMLIFLEVEIYFSKKALLFTFT